MTTVREEQRPPSLHSILREKYEERKRKVDELDRQTPRNREEALIRDREFQHARTEQAYFAGALSNFGTSDWGSIINATLDLKFPPEIVVGPGEHDLSVTWVVDNDRGDGYFKFILLPLKNAACASFWDGKSTEEPLAQLWITDLAPIESYFGTYVCLKNSKGVTMEIRKCGIHSWQRIETAIGDKTLEPQERSYGYPGRPFVSLIKPGYLCNCDIPK